MNRSRLSRQSLTPALLRLTAFRVAALGLAMLAAGCTAKSDEPSRPTIAIEVTEDGFMPSVATAPRGVPLTLVVTRTTDQTCATEIVITELAQKWDLPLGRAVRIEVPQGIRDTLHYACGMDMFHGVVVAN